jgi:hypothetical protein
MPLGDTSQFFKTIIHSGTDGGPYYPVSSAHPVQNQASAQKSTTLVMQSAAVANANGTTISTDGYNGALQLLVSNGAGTATLTVQGSYDNFATTQSALPVGLILLSDNVNGTNTARSVISGVISVASNDTTLYQVSEPYPYLQAVLSASSGLGAGTYVTGCTVSLYAMPE